MRDLMKLLKDSKDAIRDMNPEQALKYIIEFEENLQRDPLDGEAAVRLQVEIENLKDFATATYEGISDAKTHLESIIQGAEFLNVYNRKGERESNPAGMPPGKRF